jgi:hypothetical protein
MSLANLIYEKSKDLPEDRAAEVIDFIDFIKGRVRPTAEPVGDDRADAVSRSALARLAEVKVHWGGKPIPSRDDLYDEACG